MFKSSFGLHDVASVSLVSMLRRKQQKLRPLTAARSAGFVGSEPGAFRESDLVSLIVETEDTSKVLKRFPKTSGPEEVERLSDESLSLRCTLDTARQVLALPGVKRVQTKKIKAPALKEACVATGVKQSSPAKRLVKETGQGVVIGIVDTGFDLSHPVFRDAQGKLRVEGLLDQTHGDAEFTGDTLESGWNGGTNPGADADGHGTHVASIAGGTEYRGFEGVAPEARFLLVKTNFRDTDKAVSWIFRKAKSAPCVVNMSLGHHFGPHDGTDAEERLHEKLTGKGKIVVVSAGNERTDRIHLGGRMGAGESHTVAFDVARQVDDPPSAVITLWYDRGDDFAVSLVSPAGQVFDVPAVGKADNYQATELELELARKAYPWSDLVQVQVSLSFFNRAVRGSNLRNWKIRIACRAAVVGRIDGWFGNSGTGDFRSHPLVEEARTIGLPATGKGCIAVASYVTKAGWSADAGDQTDSDVVAGRISPFSSNGPTRDGRSKPEVSAPGQYVTAALASGSESETWALRSQASKRLLTIEGTSMAAPMTTGVISLLLQKRPTLTPTAIRDALRAHSVRDGHTGNTDWSPAYGYGKISAAELLANV